MGTVSVVSVIGGLWLVPDHGHGESLLPGLAVGDCANVPDHSHEERVSSVVLLLGTVSLSLTTATMPLVYRTL